MGMKCLRIRTSTGICLMLVAFGSCSAVAYATALCPPLDHRQLVTELHRRLDGIVNAGAFQNQPHLTAAATHPATVLPEDLRGHAPNSSRRKVQAVEEDAPAGHAAAPPATESATQAPALAPVAPAPTASSNSSSTSPHGVPELSSAAASTVAHKPLWPNASGRDIAMVVVAAVVLFIAAGAGVGGGPVLVPTYLLLGMFSNSAAVALSNITICGGSIANVLCTVHKRHPFKDRPLVDWDLILLMEPPTIIGAVAGSYINKIMPVWISHILLAMLLTVLTGRMAQRAKVIYTRESTQAVAARATADSRSASVHNSQHPKQEDEGQQQHAQPCAAEPEQMTVLQQPGQQDVRQPGTLAKTSSLSKEGSMHSTCQPSSSATSRQEEQALPKGQDMQLAGPKGTIEARSCPVAPLTSHPSMRALSGPLPSSVLLNIELDGHRSFDDADVSSPPNEDEAKLAYAPPNKPARRDSFGNASQRSGAAATCESTPAAGGAPVPAPEVAASGTSEAAALANVLREERQRFPLLQLCLAVAMFVFTLLTSLFSKSAAQCGSWQAWTIQLALVPSLLAICLYMRSHLLWKAKVKAEAQVDTSGELHWNASNTLVFPAICTLAGIMAGMFGLGGAVVMTPMMLELGVHHQVTAATIHPMLLFTTASATVTYAQLGDIPWTYAAVCVSIAFVMSLAGQILIDRIIQRVGRSSVLVILLACFFTIATTLTYYIVASSIVDLTKNTSLLTASGSICGKQA